MVTEDRQKSDKYGHLKRINVVSTQTYSSKALDPFNSESSSWYSKIRKICSEDS